MVYLSHRTVLVLMLCLRLLNGGYGKIFFDCRDDAIKERDYQSGIDWQTLGINVTNAVMVRVLYTSMLYMR
jgi:hypothetical protein